MKGREGEREVQTEKEQEENTFSTGEMETSIAQRPCYIGL